MRSTGDAAMSKTVKGNLKAKKRIVKAKLAKRKAKIKGRFKG